MKEFESVLEAMRYIKRELPNVEYMEELYLMHNTYTNEYFVSDDESELEKEIEEDWYNGGCEDNPDKHVKDFKVWTYVASENKERWPILYEDYKPSALSKLHIRGLANVSGEVVASFTVSR